MTDTTPPQEIGERQAHVRELRNRLMNQIPADGIHRPLVIEAVETLDALSEASARDRARIGELEKALEIIKTNEDGIIFRCNRCNWHGGEKNCAWTTGGETDDFDPLCPICNKQGLPADVEEVEAWQVAQQALSSHPRQPDGIGELDNARIYLKEAYELTDDFRENKLDERNFPVMAWAYRVRKLIENSKQIIEAALKGKTA